MKIGILGSGDVGRKLADGLIEIGYEVKIGTRDPTKEYLIQWVRNHATDERASVSTFAEAAAFGELVIIATLWNGIANAIELANPTKNIMGKIVIDVTNPLDFSEGMPPKLAIGHTDSAGETVQRLLPNAKVIKTLNIVGNPHMVHPDFPCGPPTMFICGNNEEAKNMVINSILTPFGWQTIDIGGIEGARLLEPLAMLWILHYFRTNNGNHVFKLVTK